MGSLCWRCSATTLVGRQCGGGGGAWSMTDEEGTSATERVPFAQYAG
jgi:hypothetical protein